MQTNSTEIRFNWNNDTPDSWYQKWYLSNALDTEIKNSIKTFSRESLNLLFILKEFQSKFINLLRNYLQSYLQKSNIEIDDKLFLKL